MPSADVSPPCRIIAVHHDDALRLAVQTLREGNIVALPTETVYGLAADSAQPEAIQRVFRAKGRPADHPLIMHVDTPTRANTYAKKIPRLAQDAMDAFWPGPLTVLVERSTSVHEFVTGGRATVALRCPANVFFRSIVSELDSGIVAPSANRFGHVSPTAASHVCNDLGALIDLIIDGGDSVLGLESTIIDFTTSPPQVLRHGALPVEEIAATLDTHLADPQGAQRAPGMLDSHYAPRARIRLVNDINQARELASTLHSVDQKVRILDYSNDLPMYGATLYQQLRASDDDGIEIVIAVLPEPNGLGAAIADRLHKAAVTPFEEPV